MPKPTKPNAPAPPDLLNQITQAAATIRTQSAVVLDEFRLGESQAGVLWALNFAGGSLSMRELARELRCDPSNITLISAKLEKAGLIERRAHPTDGRVRVIALTDHGTALWGRLLARLESTSPVFTLTSAERRRLSELLAKVQGN